MHGPRTAPTAAYRTLALCAQAEVAERKILAGHLLAVEAAAHAAGSDEWVLCDRCGRWRIADAAVIAQYGGEDAKFYCEYDTNRPLRGCDVATVPGEAEPVEDETLMDYAKAMMGLPRG